MLFFERKTKPFAYYFLSISGKDEADFYNEIPILNFGESVDSAEENKEDWRAKVASLTILGSVGSISPKFVGQYLPKVIPILIVQHGSTNNKVKEAATNALNAIVSTIQNPEISSLSTKILDGLVDGSGEKRLYVLEGLIAKNFVHAIDTPSTSITMPIISRCLRASSPSTHKRLACLILATFCEILEDPSGMSGYAEELVDLLIGVLLSGQSQVRGVAAKALGSIVRHLSSSNSILEGLLILNFGESVDSAEENKEDWRAKVASLTILGSVGSISPKFVGQYLPKVIPILIVQHGSTNNKVKEAATNALNAIVSTIQNPEISSLSTKILDGLVDGSGEKRLYVLEGLIAKNFVHAIDTPSTSITMPIISRCLRASSPSTHKRLACLILATFCEILEDPSGMSGYAEELVDLLIGVLLSGQSQVRGVAAKALGSMVRHLSSSNAILEGLLDTLQTKLISNSITSVERSGISSGYAQVLFSKENFSGNLLKLVTINRIALCSDDTSVQELAAECFQSLYSQMGTDVLDNIVPSLLAQIGDPATHRHAINGLTKILAYSFHLMYKDHVITILNHELIQT